MSNSSVSQSGSNAPSIRLGSVSQSVFRVVCVTCDKENLLPNILQSLDLLMAFFVFQCTGAKNRQQLLGRKNIVSGKYVRVAVLV